MIYGRKIVPKAVSSQNEKVQKQIAKGYIHYLKGREICHNIIASDANKEEELQYSGEEARVLASFIQYAHVNSQLIMPRAIRKYESTDGKRAAKAEVKQLHDRVCFRAIAVSELS